MDAAKDGILEVLRRTQEAQENTELVRLMM